MTEQTKSTKEILEKYIDEFPPNSYWYRKNGDKHYYNWIRGYTFHNPPNYIQVDVESVNIEFDKSHWSLFKYPQFNFDEQIGGESWKDVRDEYVEIDKETFDKIELKIIKGGKNFQDEKEKLIKNFNQKLPILIRDLLPNQKFLIISENYLNIGDNKKELFGLCSVPNRPYNIDYRSSNNIDYRYWIWNMSGIDYDFLEKKSNDFFYPLTTDEYNKICETFEDMKFNYNSIIDCDSDEEIINYKRFHRLDKIINEYL